MASLRQIAANRLNARKSTGPRTRDGKARSRRNALRHGLTAETIVDVLESADDYRKFHKQVIRAVQPRSFVERELTFRLVSLLWRLRRATAIESGLLSIQGDQRHTPRRDEPFFGLLARDRPTQRLRGDADRTVVPLRHGNRDTADVFVRVCNLSGDAWDKLNRYESALWRQAMQTMVVLRILRPPSAGEP
jgi:hypothetical protein